MLLLQRDEFYEEAASVAAWCSNGNTTWWNKLIIPIQSGLAYVWMRVNYFKKNVLFWKSQKKGKSNTFRKIYRPSQLVMQIKFSEILIA